MHLMSVLSCCVLVVTVWLFTEEKAWRQNEEQLFRTRETQGEDKCTSQRAGKEKGSSADVALEETKH